MTSNETTKQTTDRKENKVKLTTKQQRILDTVNEKGTAYYRGVRNESAIDTLVQDGLLKAHYSYDGPTIQIRVKSLAQTEIDFKELTRLND